MTSRSSLLARAQDAGRRQAEAFVAWARQHRALWPAAAIVLVTAVAYNLTLGSMFDYLRLETPLAYLPLLPFFSIGIALFTAHRYRNVSAGIRDRQIDFLIGIPMIVFAMLLITIVPALASTYYWSNRPDVLSMALFVGGLITIFYGINWFWRLKGALVFLVLMWPALYLNIMPGVMQSFTDATNSALAKVVHLLPLGVSLTGSPGILSVHQASGAPLTVSVGTACSGADSVLGFLLIGAAILTAVGGGGRRKLLWMVVGLAVTFAVNVLRLTSILALASSGHPELALGGYHAVIGLILFTLVIAAMMRLLPLFGLHPRPDVVATGRSRQLAPAATRRTVTVRRRRIVIGTMTALAVLVGLANQGLAPYAAFQDGTGSPSVRPFSTTSAPSGMQVSYYQDYPWAKQYFGANSTFTRYYVSGAPAAPKSSKGATTAGLVEADLVYADVVRTDDKGSLDAYNLQNCFLFHDYNITTSQRIDVGDGVTALLLNYSAPGNPPQRWATVSWAWPVDYNGQTYFERVTLTSSLTTGGADADVSPSGGFQGMLVSFLNLLNGSHDDPKLDAKYKNADALLRADATALVSHAVSHRV
jgi:exosortase/archaeosortase family protein